MIKQRTKKQQQTTRQCKPNNVGNEHNTSGLLQRSVYKNKKNGNPDNKWELKKQRTKRQRQRIEQHKPK